MTELGLRVIEAPPFGTIQDMGRIGWRRFGVSSAGAMDPLGLATANTLAGNPIPAAAIEFAYAGGQWEVTAESCRIAVSGGFQASVDGRVLAPSTSATAWRGQTISIGGTRHATWGYLAIAGGLALEPVMGSRSTHRRSFIGGFNGRTLIAGDMLAANLPAAPPGAEHSLRAADTETPGPLRAVLGPQDDRYTAESLQDFFTGTFTLTNRCDRLGYCLSGAVLRHAPAADIISDGVVPGCVQVPGNGQPIVLMRDCQPPGGYAKIACVISADLPRFAQMRPGQPVQFQQVSVAQAALLRSRYQERLAGLRGMLIPAGETR